MSADNSIAIIKINKLWYAANVQALENFSYDPVQFILANNWQSFDSLEEAHKWAKNYEDETEYGTMVLTEHTMRIIPVEYGPLYSSREGYKPPPKL